MLRRPSLPTVVSLLALFVALGGTSYAVIKLPAGSVGTRELKRNAVTGAKVRDGSIGVADLSADAAGRRGPRGAQGPVGPAGAPGSNGTGAVAEDWKPLSFAGGWTNYSAGFATGAYRKDLSGVVYLRGLLTKNGAAPAGSELIARLPAGYRPSASLLFAVAMGQPQAFGRIDVAPNGDILWVSGPVGETDSTSLDTIRFWPD